MEGFRYELMQRVEDNRLIPAAAWGVHSFESLEEAKEKCYQMCLIYQASDYLVIDRNTQEIIFAPRENLIK